MKLAFPRFRLRTALIIVALLAIPCAWCGQKLNRLRLQQRVIRDISQSGGVVFFHSQSANATDVNGRPAGRWHTRLLGVDSFHDIDSLVAHHVTDPTATMEALGNLRRLQSVDLKGADVGDEHTAALARLSNLRRLDLGFTNVGDASLPHLESLRHLQYLSLMDTHVTPAGVRRLRSKLPETEIDWWTTPSEEHHETAQQLIRLGANIFADEHDQMWILLIPAQWVGSERDLLQLGKLKDVVGLRIFHLRLSRRAYQTIAQLETLRELHLGWTQFQDADLTELTNLRLTHLSVQGGLVTDQGLQLLSEMDALESLQLATCDKIDGSGLSYLQSLPLRHLSLHDSPITDESVALLTAMRGMESLDLVRTKMTDEGLSHLAELTELRRLYVGGNAITDAGLVSLHELDKLVQLSIVHTRTTEDGVRRLQTHLRGCAIHWSDAPFSSLRGY